MRRLVRQKQQPPRPLTTTIGNEGMKIGLASMKNGSVFQPVSHFADVGGLSVHPPTTSVCNEGSDGYRRDLPMYPVILFPS